MATIAKFYLLDAATPNTGTMPSGDMIVTSLGSGTAPSGSTTVRDATDVPGTSNPDIDATCTAQATTSSQRIFLRRFVSRPLAARTFSSADGAWTFDFCSGESNTNHNGALHCRVYLWRPSTGARVGTTELNLTPSTVMSSTAETNYVSSAVAGSTVWSGAGQAILDGDILLFEVSDEFGQGMSTAYTSFFSYNGTTDHSTTTCASYVTPPSAVTLFVPPSPNPVHVASQAVQRAATRCWARRPSGIVVPKLWTPDGATI